MLRQKLPPDYIKNETFRTHLTKLHSYKRGSCIGDKVNSEKEINDRYNYAVWYLNYHMEGKKFLFIDEQSYNLTARPYYGWALKGKPFKIERKVRLQHSLSLIAAISDEGLVCFKIFVGMLKSKCFTSFVLQCMQEIENKK